MSDHRLAPLLALPASFADLEAEASAQGFSMVGRLRRGWEDGSNRFDRPGETLWGAFRSDRLIGVGGLNIDPYLDDPLVGRLRHIYVLDAERRNGVGRALVAVLLDHAAGSFRVVRLSTDRASAFYGELGFAAVDEPNTTHRLSLPQSDRAGPSPLT